MSGFAQVFLLELRLRRAVFPAALVAGIIPIPMAWIMSRNFGFSEALNAGAFAFALIGGELLALYLGVTILCKDLSEARSGFFFSRPLSGLALWAGKVSAAWTVALGAMLVCLLPATLMGWGLSSLKSPDNPIWTYDMGPQILSPLWMPLLVAMTALLLIAFAHAGSVMRFISPWIILDVVMVVLLPTLAWWAFRRVMTFQTPLLFMVLIVAFAVCLLVGLLAAGAVQTVVGRADLRRGHRALSLTLWAILAVCVLAADGYALWATAVSPKDLRSVATVAPAPAGPWIAMEGHLKHRGTYAWASFLANTQSGVYRSVGESRWGSGVTFSPDGKMAVACEMPFSFHSEPGELVSYDLSGPERPQPVRHAITISSAWGFRPTFSPDSSRLALFSDDMLAVYDLHSWKLLVAQRLDSDPSSRGSVRLLFLDRDHLRIYRGDSEGPSAGLDGTTILEFDVPQKKLQETGHVSAQPHLLRVDATRTRMLAVVQQKGTRQLTLCDGQTGALLKTLTPREPRLPVASFLGDGRIIACERRSAESFLRLFSADGDLQRTCSLGPSRIAAAGPEVRGGKVVLEIWERRTKQIDAKEVRLFDPATGDLQVISGLRPSQDWWQGAEAEQRPSGGVTSWFFPDDQGKLVRYDFQTGRASPVKF
jgi:hypothetical protein